jgi:hypothetical protein
VLQGAEDGDDLVASFGVEGDIGNAWAIEPELGVEGASHESAPRRTIGSEAISSGFQRILTRPAAIFEEQSVRNPREMRLQTRFPTATSENLRPTFPGLDPLFLRQVRTLAAPRASPPDDGGSRGLAAVGGTAW